MQFSYHLYSLKILHWLAAPSTCLHSQSPPSLWRRPAYGFYPFTLFFIHPFTVVPASFSLPWAPCGQRANALCLVFPAQWGCNKSFLNEWTDGFSGEQRWEESWEDTQGVNWEIRREKCSQNRLFCSVALNVLSSLVPYLILTKPYKLEQVLLLPFRNEDTQVLWV